MIDWKEKGIKSLKEGVGKKESGGQNMRSELKILGEVLGESLQ